MEILTDEEAQALADEANTTSSDSSNEEDNKAKGEALLASLQPNSKTPLGYRDFRLEIQSNPNNTTSLTERRVVGYEMESNILTIATEFSFSTNTETLIQECKNLIDQYLIKIIPQPNPVEEALVEEPEIEYWGYLSDKSPKRWFLIFEGVEIEFDSESEYFLDRIERGFQPDYSEFNDRGEDPGYTAPKTPYFWWYQPENGAIFFHSGEILWGEVGSNDLWIENTEHYLAILAQNGFPSDYTERRDMGEQPGYLQALKDEADDLLAYNDYHIDNLMTAIIKIKIAILKAISDSSLSNKKQNQLKPRINSHVPTGVD